MPTQTYKLRMKKYLKIENKGLLDIRLIFLMGGTTKSNSEHKIGQFGSGLKYCLAYLLRNKVDFKIFIGKEQIKIKTISEKIRDEEFEIITVNYEKTSITTKMGMDWKPWMIIREIYSNALDEGSAKYQIVSKVSSGEDKTCFFIELTPEFLEVYNNWNKYFIVGNIPMWENSGYAVHPQDGNLRLYKQGILIKEFDQKSLFNYDIKNARINELREYNGVADASITSCLFQIDDKKVIDYFLSNVEEDHYEGSMDYDWNYHGKFNIKWKECIGNAKIIHKEAKDKLLGANPNADLSSSITVPKPIFKALTKEFDNISTLRVIDKVNEFFEIYDEELNLKVKQALTILEEAGYFIHLELKFIFGEFGDKRTLAEISLDKKEILISQKMKDKSIFDFCSMLVEENEHFQTGFKDHTREFQQHFIDLYTKSILDKAEIKL